MALLKRRRPIGAVLVHVAGAAVQSPCLSGSSTQRLGMVAFRQFEKGISRRVSSHPVTGAGEEPRIRVTFLNGDGPAFQIDALIDANPISGTYSLRHGTVGLPIGASRGPLRLDDIEPNRPVGMVGQGIKRRTFRNAKKDYARHAGIRVTP